MDLDPPSVLNWADYESEKKLMKIKIKLRRYLFT